MLFSTSFMLIVVMSLQQGCIQGQNQNMNSSDGIKTDIAYIDLIRSQIESIPTTKENVASRHAALVRW